MIIDDIWNLLNLVWGGIQNLPLSMVTDFVLIFLAPLFYPVLHIIETLLGNLITLINAIINLVNIIMNIPNMFTTLMNQYYYYFPSEWTTPLIMGIGLRFWYAFYDTIKRHIPGLA